MLDKILVANRGEIACRIINTCKNLKIKSVAIYSSIDYESSHVNLADEAIQMQGVQPRDNYLNIPKIIQIAKETGAKAVHPGYGFLSENVEFAKACLNENIVFIGPSIEQLESFGLKHVAKELAQKAKVPLSPGTELLSSIDEAQQAALKIGFPVMLKSTAGGGGIGLQLCLNQEELLSKYQTVERLAKSNFSNSGLFLEKYVQQARHIEVQIFGDGLGNIVVLGERDCSVQRRNQKVLEETPAINLAQDVREKLHDAARRLGESIKYQSAGTVEFVFDSIQNQFYFLEVNTRLQVEHGVTEMVYGVDLVEWMILQASGDFKYEEYKKYNTQKPQGHAMQLRIYAEDPAKNFQPSSGLITHVEFPKDIRVDTWIQQGTPVSSQYDPLLAKLICHRTTRQEVIEKLQNTLEVSEIYGLQTNQNFLKIVLQDKGFLDGHYTTKFVNDLKYSPNTMDVLSSGGMTTIQDYPGRIGYWAVGIPPSGPYDALSFRLGNKILGNSDQSAGLEITLMGPTLRFNQSTNICLTGAVMQAHIEGQSVPYYSSVKVQQGQVLSIGKLKGDGIRSFLCIQEGFDVPEYLHSKATFTLGQFGGHCGRVLKTGDVLRLGKCLGSQKARPLTEINKEIIPQLLKQWSIRVLYGPHGAPEFFVPEDIDTIKSFQYKVHYNSDRTGIRLIGPRPKWARKSGGEAGLHPSNIHDNAYAIGAINFTGDMPIILGPDGPSCGGFVCPFVTIQADLWKLGQLKAGDFINFNVVNLQQAHDLFIDQENAILGQNFTKTKRSQNGQSIQIHNTIQLDLKSQNNAILYEVQESQDRPRCLIRRQGDQYLLVEYGPIILDINLRFRIHTLMTKIEGSKIKGIINLVPGVRSLQIQYDQCILLVQELTNFVVELDSNLPLVDQVEVPTRVIHMPLSWEDESIQEAIQKYMQSVRKDAPWCPSNIEFTRRANGLKSMQDVYDIVFNATYLVLALGDVYLGAPVATPLNPMHRLVTTKYNPARTWTPQNAVGIGGVYLCIYGMEGPGGYQLNGRTVQIWNTYRTTKEFTQGYPWLLRFFDQIKFYPVSNQELGQLRKQFPLGRFSLKIEEKTFKLKDYQNFLKSNEKQHQEFKKYTQDSFHRELESWGDAHVARDEADTNKQGQVVLPDNCTFVDAPIAGSLWKLQVKKGDAIKVNQVVAIIESMKTEIQVNSTSEGLVYSILCQEQQALDMGQHLLICASN